MRAKIPSEAAPSGFFIGQGNALDAADQIGQRRIEQQIFQRVTVGGADELNAALIDGARRLGFTFPADLIDDDDLRVVILHRLDHGFVLVGRARNLHAAGAADGRMRNIAVTTNLVAGIDDDHPFLLGQNAGHFAQHRRFADSGATQNEDAMSFGDDILDDGDSAIDSAADATRQAHDLLAPVANAGNAVQGASDSRPIVVIEIADAGHNLFDLFVGDLGLAQHTLAIDVTSSRQAAEIHDDLQEFVLSSGLFNAQADTIG